MTIPVSFDQDALATACAALTPNDDHEHLARVIRQITGLPLKVVLVDDGWFRLGGLVDGQGARVAEDLEGWVAEQSGGDLLALFNSHAEAGYQVTRLTGRRVYLTASVGTGPLDFIQFEVDEVQEVLAGPLFDGEHIPDTLDELMDRLPQGGKALGEPRYLFRRVTDFSVMTDLVADHKGDPRIRRFTQEWAASSAQRIGHFCDRFALMVQPYRNEDGEHVLEARPLPNFLVALPDLQESREHQVDYHPARQVQEVDELAGFPMAWYFLQVTQHYAHYRSIADVLADFRAMPAGTLGLPAHDRKLVEGWVSDPYTFH